MNGTSPASMSLGIQKKAQIAQAPIALNSITGTSASFATSKANPKEASAIKHVTGDLWVDLDSGNNLSLKKGSTFDFNP